MYKGMYNTFDEDHIPYSYPLSFQDDKRFDYLNGTECTYELDFGDTVTIPFSIGCCYQNCYIDIIVYNFRYEEVYRVSMMPSIDGLVYLELTNEVSNQIFKRGIYYIQVQAYQPVLGGEPWIYTLIDKSKCSVRVK